MTDNMRPLVSIGIPTYNRADGFLRQALQSAVDQTYPNVEIIVSDNCSTDQTESLVRSFSSSRIRYHKHPQNIGAINNFNYCLEQASGHYFLMLHDDDLIDPDLIDCCMVAVNDGIDTGVIITGARLINGEGKVFYESPNRLEGCPTPDFFLGWFASKVQLYLCNTLYNTKQLKKLGGFHSKTDHFLDMVATAKLAAQFGRVDVHDVKASFRRHANNMGGNPNKVDLWSEDSLFLIDVLCDQVSDEKEKQNIRRAGNEFLTRKSYHLASAIKSPGDRMRTYLRVFKMFDRSYSPGHFWFDKYIKAYFMSAVRKIRHLK
jgi:glycosyltransferase involved in cell wall biosynthesis